ncbi:transporter [Streptomyces cheonanensis]|uniref:Transporter n=1 Tax=Streptomyces cheonanensis TaxID=312720 RepID=A0ABP5GN14_9ACTN|nr:transporter [Streptomyces harbinensis]QKV70253.1 transporter [Streptomyces harbinensis]
MSTLTEPGAAPATAPAPRGTYGDTAVITATFVRLKLALMRNGLRQTTGRKAGFISSAVLGALFGALGMAGLLALGGSRHMAALGTVLVALIALFWAFVPVFLGAVDETLDPARLAMLPLRPRSLMTAQLVASVVGVGPIFTTLLVAGAALGTARGAGGYAVAVVAIVLTVLTCTVLSRAVATANAGLLTSRKGRDLAILSGVVIALGIQGVNLAVQKLADGRNAEPVHTMADVARWLPPATSVEAVRAVSAGAYGVAAAALAGTVAALGLLLWWWQRSLTRLMTSRDGSTVLAGDGGQESEKERTGSGGALWERLLPAGRSGVVAQRALRYAWRDPKAKMSWAMAIGMGLLFPVIWASTGSATVYHACWGAGLLGMQMYNQFGMDYSGFWLVAQTITSARDAYAELRGRMLAIALVGVPFTVTVVLVAAVVVGDWGQLPAALGISLALLGALLGCGALASVLFPYSVPQDNAMRNVGAGQVSLVWYGIVGGLVASALLCAPLIALTIWLHASAAGWAWVVLPLGAGYGAVVAWAGLRLAAGRTVERLPEILAAVSRS